VADDRHAQREKLLYRQGFQVLVTALVTNSTHNGLPTYSLATCWLQTDRLVKRRMFHRFWLPSAVRCHQICHLFYDVCYAKD